MRRALAVCCARLRALRRAAAARSERQEEVSEEARAAIDRARAVLDRGQVQVRVASTLPQTCGPPLSPEAV